MQTEDGMLYKMAPSGYSSTEEYPLRANENDYYYLMRDQKSLSIDGNFPADFLDSMNKIAKTTGSRQSYSASYEYKPSPKSRFYKNTQRYYVDTEVYYNTDKILVSPGADMVQYNGRCYFLDSNSYVDENDVSSSWRPYQIFQMMGTSSSRKYLDDIVKNYISSTYAANYFDAAHYVENKSVPVYDLGGDALDHVRHVV